ncbi:2-dehydro-3-deoxygalactonokinase [Acidiphilium sp. PA]|uniref:2-dehydro-3-deoxygalactonokinase n=1 Tax=Acidiphilium sp. PA TaxID=2871705 RepID=UPI0022439134|nr:2-dehydro-3-deoxygalactonokinase [Acidiphilium sp. PA]MCW8306864.1 2-dehydro-3-deoxygalactonokinase [Acidiphilium sp. PA]
MIGVDWGTTSLRAWRLDQEGSVLDRRASPQGIMTITDRQFEPVLRDIVGDWLADGERHILLCGMIGSRQGWHEVAYLSCPAGIDEIAARLTPVAFAGAAVRIVPGLATIDENGIADIMRGEETQILGAAASDGATRRICLPGTHSKWAAVSAGRIERFSTYMTGEMFAALAQHTILARTTVAGPIDPAAFTAGVARAADTGGLLHHAFGVRTQVLRQGMTEAAAYAYLSGLMIGHELNAALDSVATPVAVVGASALAALYVTAIASRGGVAIAVDEAAGATGLARLGARATWT